MLCWCCTTNHFRTGNTNLSPLKVFTSPQILRPVSCWQMEQDRGEGACFQKLKAMYAAFFLPTFSKTLWGRLVWEGVMVHITQHQPLYQTGSKMNRAQELTHTWNLLLKNLQHMSLYCYMHLTNQRQLLYEELVLYHFHFHNRHEGLNFWAVKSYHFLSYVTQTQSS